MSQKIIHILVGAVISWVIIWAVFAIIGYSFYLTDISIDFLGPVGIFVAIGEVVVATLPYWFLRRRYPYLAKGVMIGIGLTVLVILLLLPFSEM